MPVSGTTLLNCSGAQSQEHCGRRSEHGRYKSRAQSRLHPSRRETNSNLVIPGHSIFIPMFMHSSPPKGLVSTLPPTRPTSISFCGYPRCRSHRKHRMFHRAMFVPWKWRIRFQRMSDLSVTDGTLGETHRRRSVSSFFALAAGPSDLGLWCTVVFLLVV